MYLPKLGRCVIEKRNWGNPRFEEFKAFNIENYLPYCDHYELLDNAKVYTREIYDFDYGKGIKKYTNQLYTIVDDDIIHCVVAIEFLTEKERLLLQNYCCCDYCTSYFKFLSNQYNQYGKYGCLKIPFVDHCYRDIKAAGINIMNHC